jgi:glycosyltransferase involved in cell wall biosynthesis
LLIAGEKLKVGLICGLPRYTRGLSNALQKIGIEVKTVNLSPLLRTSFYLRFKLFQMLRTCDILHVGNAYEAWLPYFFKKLYGIPYVLTVHSIPYYDFWLEEKRGKVYYLIEHLSVYVTGKRADGVIAPSQFIQRKFKEIYNIDSVVVPHGVDLSVFNPEITGEKIRQKLGVADSKIVLFTGRFYPMKDPLTLVRAIPFVLRHHPLTYFILIGDGDLFEKARLEARRLGIIDRVLLKEEWVENLNEYFAAADIFVLPSLFESFGLVLIEAMACGVPIVASNAGSMPEVIGNAGLLFKPGNHRELANCINTILADDQLAKELGARGIDRVKRYFTWELVAKQHAEVYRQVLHKAKK